MTVKLKFKELEIMYTQIKRTNGGEKNNTPRSFTFSHTGGGEEGPVCEHEKPNSHSSPLSAKHDGPKRRDFLL